MLEHNWVLGRRSPCRACCLRGPEVHFSSCVMPEYFEAEVPEHLSSCVTKLWTYSGDLSELILPTGSLDIVLHLGGAPRSQGQSAVIRSEPRALIAGQLTRPVRLWTAGPAEIISARLTPSGLTRFFDFSVPELTNSSIGLIDTEIVSASTLDRLFNQIESEKQLKRRLARFVVFLSDYLRPPPVDQRVNEALCRIIRSSGTLSVQQLANQIGISERTLQRRFLREIGVRPKMYSRIVRLRHAVEMASKRPDLSWAAIAMWFGYFDQPHFIRECTELYGASPGSLQALGSAITDELSTTLQSAAD